MDDPELTLNGYYVLCYITHLSFGAHHKNFSEDRPHTIKDKNIAHGLQFLLKLEVHGRARRETARRHKSE